MRNTLIPYSCRTSLSLVLAGTILAACSGPTTTVVTTTETPVVETSAAEHFEQAVALWGSSDRPDWNRIADHLEEAVDEDPSYSDAWFNLGVAYEALGQPSDAERAYRQSNDVAPEKLDGLVNLGTMLAREGDVPGAERVFLSVVESEQFHPEANINLAQIHRIRAQDGQGLDVAEADQAINRVRMALAGDSRNAHAYETLSSVYFDLGRYDLAKLVCINAIAMGVDSAALHNRLGLIALAQDDVTAAYAQFRSAVDMDPLFTEAAMNLGAITLNYRNYEGALAAFQAVLAVSPDDIDALISRSVALRGLEQYAEAEAGYMQVLGMDDGNLSALYNLGVLYMEHLQDYEVAVSWFEQYVRADISGRSDLIDDVEVRIQSLRQTIQFMQESQSHTPEPTPDEPEDSSQDDMDPVDETAPDDGGTGAETEAL